MRKPRLFLGTTTRQIDLFFLHYGYKLFAEFL